MRHNDRSIKKKRNVIIAFNFNLVDKNDLYVDAVLKPDKKNKITLKKSILLKDS